MGWGGETRGAAAAVGGCLAWAGRPGLLLGTDGNAQGRGMLVGEWDVAQLQRLPRGRNEGGCGCGTCSLR
jgi:hypothetical protein